MSDEVLIEATKLCSAVDSQEKVWGGNRTKYLAAILYYANKIAMTIKKHRSFTCSSLDEEQRMMALLNLRCNLRSLIGMLDGAYGVGVDETRAAAVAAESTMSAALGNPMETGAVLQPSSGHTNGNNAPTSSGRKKRNYSRRDSSSPTNNNASPSHGTPLRRARLNLGHSFGSEAMGRQQVQAAARMGQHSNANGRSTPDSSGSHSAMSVDKNPNRHYQVVSLHPPRSSNAYGSPPQPFVGASDMSIDTRQTDRDLKAAQAAMQTCNIDQVSHYSGVQSMDTSSVFGTPSRKKSCPAGCRILAGNMKHHWKRNDLLTNYSWDNSSAVFTFRHVNVCVADPVYVEVSDDVKEMRAALTQVLQRMISDPEKCAKFAEKIVKEANKDTRNDGPVCEFLRRYLKPEDYFSLVFLLPQHLKLEDFPSYQAQASFQQISAVGTARHVAETTSTPVDSGATCTASAAGVNTNTACPPQPQQQQSDLKKPAVPPAAYTGNTTHSFGAASGPSTASGTAAAAATFANTIPAPPLQQNQSDMKKPAVPPAVYTGNTTHSFGAASGPSTASGTAAAAATFANTIPAPPLQQNQSDMKKPAVPPAAYTGNATHSFGATTGTSTASGTAAAADHPTTEAPASSAQPGAEPFTSLLCARSAPAPDTTAVKAPSSAGDAISRMTISELIRELNKVGIDCGHFVEKSEMIAALHWAHAGGKQAPPARASSNSSSMQRPGGICGQGSSSTASSAPVPGMAAAESCAASEFRVGEVLNYIKFKENLVPATVAKVFTDDKLEPYYSVVLSCGKLIHTEASRLRPATAAPDGYTYKERESVLYAQKLVESSRHVVINAVHHDEGKASYSVILPCATVERLPVEAHLELLPEDDY